MKTDNDITPGDEHSRKIERLIEIQNNALTTVELRKQNIKNITPEQILRRIQAFNRTELKFPLSMVFIQESGYPGEMILSLTGKVFYSQGGYEECYLGSVELTQGKDHCHVEIKYTYNIKEQIWIQEYFEDLSNEVFGKVPGKPGRKASEEYDQAYLMMKNGFENEAEEMISSELDPGNEKDRYVFRRKKTMISIGFDPNSRRDKDKFRKAMERAKKRYEND
jgi:hypothetical protein